MNMTLTYWFGRDEDVEFEYEADVDILEYVEDYIKEKYYDVEDAVESLYGIVEDDDEKKEALKCKTMSELSDFLITNEADFMEETISEDDEFMDEILDDIKEKYEDEAQEEFDEEDDGCDPDGFYGWGDYYRWKNG